MNESTNLSTLLATLRQPPTSAATSLPADYAEAVATVNRALIGNDLVGVAECFDVMAKRNAMLTGTPEALADALAVQTQLLERLMLSYVVKAEQTTKPEHKHLAMRTALACQRQAASTLCAIYQVKHAR